jgi:hypothetical protein
VDYNNQNISIASIDNQRIEVKKSNIEVYDFCIAWNWEYDNDFVNLLEKNCNAYNYSLLQITQNNFKEIIDFLENDKLVFKVYLDRGSDVDPAFFPIVKWAKEHEILSLNPYERSLRSADKAIMHHVFANAGLYIPYTYILPSFDESPEITVPDLTALGDQFIMKPAMGAGGIGVMKKLTTKEQVLEVRKQYHNDKYLVQKTIVPRQLNGIPAWFRVLYCAGHIYSCWWDPSSHLYKRVTTEEEIIFNLQSLRQITSRIANISGLTLFSTEIAYTPDDMFIVVDYVNDPVDLRLNSKAYDGVPDSIVESIAKNLVELAARNIGVEN